MRSSEKKERMKKENDNRVAVSFTEMSASKAPLLRRVQSASVFLFCAVLTLCLQPLQGQSQTLHLLEQTAQGSAAPQFPQPQIVPQNAYLWSIPVGLIATGTVLLNRLVWFDLNLRVRDALRYREYRARHVDDILQFVPMSGAIGLDIYQIGRNENWQPLFESASSIALMVILVHSVKLMNIELRPDNSTWNSFPSGHTATAFVGVELLRQKLPSSCWYVYTVGYAAAATTAYLRIYHNRHWLGDTLAGAAMGIAAAWIGTKLTRLYFNRNRRR